MTNRDIKPATLLSLARAAHLARTTDMPVAESMPALGAFEEACSPSTIIALCERVEALEVALRKSVDLGRELLAETDSDDEDFDLRAHELTALRALAMPVGGTRIATETSGIIRPGDLVVRIK